IEAIDPVEKNQARVAAGPRGVDQPLENKFRADLTDRLSVLRVSKVNFLVFGERSPERIRRRDADIKVGRAREIPLEVDELKNVGMVDAQDAHVGPATGSALLDRLGGGIENLKERDWAARDAMARTNDRALVPQA